MDYRRVVLGIGNPGDEYADTRHNAGFMVVERLAERAGLRLRRLERRSPDGSRRFGGKVKAKIAEGSTPEPYLLVEPLTYVNLSGDVAGPLLRAAGLSPESLFVVVDDLNLPLGRLRIRPSGSSGGHNGLESIATALGSDGYPRLRLGIGPGTNEEAGAMHHAEFVLDRFLPGERQVLQLVIERAADAVEEWLAGASIEDLMGRHNGFRAGGPGEATD